MIDRSNLEFEVSDEAYRYCVRILDEMQTQFDMPFEEALGRMNRHWKDSRFVDEDEVNVLTHERARDWARFIVYQGPWWVDGETPRVRPYP